MPVPKHFSIFANNRSVGYATAGDVKATRLAQQAMEDRNGGGTSYIPDPTDVASDSDGGETEADGSGSGVVGEIGGASSSKVHHPYAKVKKRPKDHPYATVKKPQAPVEMQTNRLRSFSTVDGRGQFRAT